MLIKDFYKIVSFNEVGLNKYEINVFINEDHDIFKGHFPGNPVMPGVSMMQIIKELTVGTTKQNLIMQHISNVKFMALINPFVNPELKIELELLPAQEDRVKLKGSVSFDSTTAMKLSTTYKVIH